MKAQTKAFVRWLWLVVLAMALAAAVAERASAPPVVLT